MVEKVVDSMVTNILSYCKCQYTREYIRVWYVKCRQNLVDSTSNVILIAQLMPTNLYDSSYIMEAMSKWVVSSGVAGMVIDGELMRIDQNCKVQIEHPYGRDCSEKPPAVETSTATTTSTTIKMPTTTTVAVQNQFSTNNDDNNSAGAAVGGVIAGLVIICITIVVLVVIVMLLRRREKK